MVWVLFYCPYLSNAEVLAYFFTHDGIDGDVEVFGGEVLLDIRFQQL
ncbi:hypothetical protein GXP69_18560, partial [Pontibacter sp. BT327]|nr:hypothetical protein [Pontibacter burrus]